jgi:chromosome segregation ATPase
MLTHSSGKSNILEALSFGLGEKLTNLRVSSIKEISAPHCEGNRTQVDLHFEKCKCGTKMIISSAIKDGARLFFVNKAKVTKKMWVVFCASFESALTTSFRFDTVLNRDLGFAQERSCFNIRQRAAQQIV